ncbi:MULTISPECIES: hypothetical protein [unclassified Ruegeria]|nr:MULTISPECIES: hypothetical protein [unclassified Ruegeria]NOD78601.1 hypothetical protein [Ruegeria sp. HKCCD4332]NOD90914.1 hypothetical protein [Ruegeria sp. HKCCD4318]NOD95194.1 hypothetical protein [Ruegeria sp. HKCCD4884]NOE16302.1 hypothetical protein [Ruegeria sp. HKCCD4318-2]NOG11772.1 hypothetical protein [Ruegeria sp. HKCCD4315]
MDASDFYPDYFFDDKHATPSERLQGGQQTLKPCIWLITLATSHDVVAWK